MNSHKNARLTFEGRKLLIGRIAVMGLVAAAQAAGISAGCARKWERRFELEGGSGIAGPQLPTGSHAQQHCPGLGVAN